MENLENAEIVKNTSQNMPEIKHFIILPHKNNKYFMLGVGNNGKEDYVGTFILDNDRYFKGSKIEKIEKKPDGKLQIFLQIFTGRTHQIRYHLSSHGLPIYGDYLYGREAEIPMQLTAYQLEFKDLDGEMVRVEI